MPDDQNAQNAQNAQQAQNAQNAFFRTLVDRLNNQRPAQMKTVPCENYKAGGDFRQWSTLFLDSLRAVNNLTTSDADKLEVNRLAVKWVPTKLESGAVRSVYDNLAQAIKDDWELLKPALEEAFRDTSEEIRFLNSESAWKRRPGQSLQDYKNGLILRLDKYQGDLRTVQAEWEKQAVRRFRAGLDNPVLSMHILMSCTGPKHTLEEAFNVACTFENTIQTIGESGNGAKGMDPSMASLLTIPQMASLSLEPPPQFSALSPQQEKNEKRLDMVETALKKNELDMTELKAGVTEVKESIKTLKGDMDQSKYRQNYQQRVRSAYPVARMPLYNQYARPQFRPPYGRYTVPGSQIAPGLTGGPGFVTNQPTPNYAGQTGQTARVNQGLSLFNPQTGKVNDSKDSKEASVPNLGAVEGQAESEGASGGSFANPHLQWGASDTGYGWSGENLNDAVAYGYDQHPEGMYVFSDLPF